MNDLRKPLVLLAVTGAAVSALVLAGVASARGVHLFDLPANRLDSARG
jgi:hypothetical protein